MAAGWNACLQAQTQVIKTVVVVLVQFSDSASNPDARGSRGLSGESTYTEFKYRYRDYFDIFFQESDPVTHPNAADSAIYSVFGMGWYQHGSFARYIHDNSFGSWEILPKQINPGNEQHGILNTLDNGGDNDIRNAKINWLPIDMPKPDTGTAGTNKVIGEAAIAALDSILPQSWDWSDVSTLLILYAGNQIKGAGAATYVDTIGGQRVWFCVAPERENDRFAPPRIWFHELVHAVTESNVDLYETNGGHYSLMGSSLLNAYTPPLLDPWLRITLGWLNVETYDTAGEWTNIDLPAVGERDNGEKPWVLVVPVTGENPTTSDWSYSDKAYLIVENRRIFGWDINLNRDDNHGSPTFGQVISGVEGGFLVWGAGTLGPDWLRPYEADGDYILDYEHDKHGDPFDFYPFGGDRFGVWTRPGLLDRMRATAPSLSSTDLTRNVFMSFPTYTTTTNRNRIGRLILDRLIIEEQDYHGNLAGLPDPLNDVSPTKYNNQNKTCWFDGALYMGFHDGRVAYVSRSTDAGTSWRDLFVLTPTSGKGNQREYQGFDNVALTETSIAVWASCERHDENDAASDLFFKRVTTAIHTPYQQTVDLLAGRPLRSSIAALDSVLVFVIPQTRSLRLDTAGLYAWISTNDGVSWGNPQHVSMDALTEAQNASMTLRKIDTGQGTDAYFYDAVYQGSNLGTLWWYSSQSKHNSMITSTSANLSSPHHVYCNGELRIVCMGKSQNANLHKYSINFLQVPVDGSAYQQPINILQAGDNGIVKRDPEIVTYQEGDGLNHLITWVEGDGRSMYFADNQGSPQDWFKAKRSSFTVIPSMTSYPLALMGAGNEPMIGSTVNVPEVGWPMNLWQLKLKTRSEDIADYSVWLDLVTGKTVTLEGNGMRQELHHGEPTIHDGTGARIGSVRYAFNSPSRYWTFTGGTPFDTLTATEEVTLFAPENVRYSIQVVSDTIPDTTFVEGYLLESATGNILGTSGEYRVPPNVTDTTLVFGLELPSGVPAATVSIHTKVWRGMLDPNAPCQLLLSREHLFADPVVPKECRNEVREIASAVHDLHLFPTASNGSSTLTVIAPFSGAMTIRVHSMLGQEYRHVEISEVEQGRPYPLRLPALPKGMYLVSCFFDVGVRSTRIIVR
ncbi:MAG: hypothetical protein IH600_08400 [Bacteroidetes bacterium]|nr:hypothetical protein [Bacteroidota bacterium]